MDPDSTTIDAPTGQNRSAPDSLPASARNTYRIRYEPHLLADELPIFRERHDRPDAEITWLHRHNVLQLGVCHEGTGIFVVEGKVMTFRAGTVVVIDPSEAHSARSSPGTISRWTFLFLDLPRLLPPGFHDPAILDTSPLAGMGFHNTVDAADDQGLGGLITALADECDQPEAVNHRDAVRGLAAAIAARLQRLPGRNAAPTPARRAQVNDLLPALQYVNTHFEEEISVPLLADLCGMGVSTFRRRFQQAFATSPKAHVIRYRLSCALSRLEAGDSVLSASLASGFQSLSAFNRHFRSEFGINPRDWRAGRLSGRDGATPVRRSGLV